MSDKGFEVFLQSWPTAWTAKIPAGAKTAVHAAAEKLAEWGAFSPADVRELADQGWDIHIYRTG